MRYTATIMMARTQITLDPELHRRARQRAAELRVSLAEYLRCLVARDLEEPERRADPSLVFDLGDSRGSDIARNKDAKIGDAIAAAHDRVGQ